MIRKSLTIVGILLLLITSAFASGSEDCIMHIHTFACYMDWELKCNKDHEHFSWCYDGIGDPICGLVEGAEYSSEEVLLHTTPFIAEKVLICYVPEHQHTDKCLRVIPSKRIQNHNCLNEVHDSYFISNRGIDPDYIEGLCICTCDEHIHTEECFLNIYLLRSNA